MFGLSAGGGALSAMAAAGGMSPTDPRIQPFIKVSNRFHSVAAVHLTVWFLWCQNIYLAQPIKCFSTDGVAIRLMLLVRLVSESS